MTTASFSKILLFVPEAWAEFGTDMLQFQGLGRGTLVPGNTSTPQ